jgi:hypothetical protein
VIVEFDNPKYSLASCPKCGQKMREALIVGLNAIAVMKTSVEIVSSLSYLYLYNEYYLWVGSLYLGKTFLVPLVVVIMLLSVVGLWVGRGICVGIVVSTSWVMLVIIIILGS